MTDDFETIEWSLDEDSGIGRITLNRPDSLNALSATMLVEIAEAFERFEERDVAAEGVATRIVVVEGAGDRAFSAGADIEEFGDEAYPHVDRTWRRTFETVAEAQMPVVAKVDGYCVGGGLELALAFDFRIASDRSEFGFPEIELGIYPSGGGTQRLPRLVGPSRAKELCMTGEFVSGTQAAEEGLVDHVYPADELDAAVEEFAETVAGKPPLGVRAIKDTVDRSQELGLTQGIEYEYQASLPLAYTADYEAGVAAFGTDEEPEWEGR